MPIEWVTMTGLASELDMNYRTFKIRYSEKYPPDREQGNRKWWLRTTVNKIKEKEFGIVVKSELQPT